MSREVTYGQLGQDNVGPGLDASFEFVVNDLPFGFYNRLIFPGGADAHFSIFLFGFEFQFDIEEQNLRLLKLLGHLFKSSIRKGFLEGDTFHKERLTDITSWDLLDGNPLINFIYISLLVELGDGTDHHRSKQILMTRNELTIQSRRGTLQEHSFLIRCHRHASNLVDS